MGNEKIERIQNHQHYQEIKKKMILKYVGPSQSEGNREIVLDEFVVGNRAWPTQNRCSIVPPGVFQ